MTDQTDNEQQPSSHPPVGLGLQVPPLSPPPVGTFLTDPKQTGQWFDTLPMANIGEAARHLFKALVDMNRMVLTDKVRIRNAERFRHPVSYITGNLAKHYLDKGFPLAGKNQKVSALARELHAELALSYKISIENILAGPNEEFDRDLLAIALHRALDHIGHLMFESALVYAPPPAGTWREANAIYAYALKNNIQEVAIRDSKQDDSAGVTIARVYQGLVLLSTASPARLSQTQIQHLRRRIPDWSQHVRLLKPGEEAAGSGMFSVDVAADEPPMHLSLVQDTTRRGLVFDVTPLLGHLRQELETLPWETGSDLKYNKGLTPRGLLRSLMLGWSKSPARKFVRTRLNFELHVVVGVGTVHDLICGNPDHAERFSPAEQDLLPDPTAVDYDKDLWGGSGSFSLAPLESGLTPEGSGRATRFGATLGADIMEQPKPPQPSEVPDEEVLHVETSNESAGGYCICWQRDSLPKVRVGELIGIQSASNQQQFGVCVVRWLRHPMNQPLEIGLQILAPRCEAGEVCVAAGGKPQPSTRRVNCLMITEHSGNAEGNEALIIQSTQFHEGSTLWLFIGDSTRRIRLTRQIELGPSYVQFEFEEATDKEAGAGNAGPNDFDDIWSTL